MPRGSRWPRRGLLAVVAAALALVSIMVDPSAGDSALGDQRDPATGLAAAAPSPEPASEPLRIMPLGSSSTVGAGSAATAGFRGPLEAMLAGDRIAFDMVGSQHSGPSSLPDRDHEGHGGWTMARMQPLVNGWVARQHPDVILLQVGTNDLIAGVGAAATAHRLDTMLTTIASASNAYVIVAGVWAPLPTHALARAQYARLASAVVTRHRAAGQGATFVDTSTLLTRADLYDGLHPDAMGYRKIARIWERAIRAHVTARELTQRPDSPAAEATVGYRAFSPSRDLAALTRSGTAPSVAPGI